MLEQILKWMYLAAAFAGAIVALIPSVIALVRSFKARLKACDEAEVEKATNDMRERLDELIVEAELAYKDIEAVLKAKGNSAGSIKKKMVLSDLQSYAIEKGYDMDREYWSNKIDEVVKITKNVNAASVFKLSTTTAADTQEKTSVVSAQ